MRRRHFRTATLCCILAGLWGHPFRSAAQAIGAADPSDAGQITGTKNANSGRQTTVSMPGGPPPGPVHIGAFFPDGSAFGLQEETEIVRNESYQAEAVTEIRQTLANGAHIFQTITATVARDRDGRTIRSQKLGQDRAFVSIFRVPGKSPASSPPSGAPTLTVVFDPVAKEHIDYLSDVKIAHIMPIEISPVAHSSRHVRAFSGAVHEGGGPITAFPIPGATDGRMFPGGVPATSIMMFPPGDSVQQDAKTEALGTRTVEGLKTVGTRRTWTIPKGTIGNDRALITTEEIWYSPKLKLVLQSVRDDPRFGQTTYTLRDLRLIDPIRKLFRIPPGYRIETLPTPPPSPGPPDTGGSR